MNARVVSYRKRRFVPSCPGAERGSCLERRSLAAPAIFRLALANEGPAGDIANAQVQGTNLPVMLVTNDSYSAVGGSSVVVDPATGTTFTMAGSVTTQVVDVSDPGTGAPVGNSTVSMNIGAQIHFTTTGTALGLVNSFGANGGVERNYILADTGTVPPNSPVVLTEHFNSVYLPPINYTTTIDAGSNVYNNLTGFQVVVDGNLQGIDQVNIIGSFPGGALTNYDPLTSGPVSGTITPFFGPAGASLSFTISSTQVDVTSKAVVGPLAISTPRNPVTGNANGTPMRVTLGAGVGVTAADDPGLTDQTTITGHYDAHF